MNTNFSKKAYKAIYSSALLFSLLLVGTAPVQAVGGDEETQAASVAARLTLYTKLEVEKRDRQETINQHRIQHSEAHTAEACSGEGCRYAQERVKQLDEQMASLVQGIAWGGVPPESAEKQENRRLKNALLKLKLESAQRKLAAAAVPPSPAAE